jgi:hypothetical protein
LHLNENCNIFLAGEFAHTVKNQINKNCCLWRKLFKFSCTKDAIDGGIDEEVIAASAKQIEKLPNI